MAEPVSAGADERKSATARLSPLRIDRGGLQPMRKRRRRWAWSLAAAVVLAGAVALALAPRRAEVQSTSVLVAYPSQQYAQLTASGYVVAQRRAAVASKATGRLVELKVREGSVVKKDEVIARLDASDVQASIGAAQAGVQQAHAAERLADAGIRQAEAASRQARITLANAEADLKRTLGLEAQGFVSAQAVDAAQTRVNGASAQMAAAEAGLAQAQAARAQAQASLAQAAAQLKVQRVNEDFTLIRAPFDGVVLVKNANVGDIITPFSSAAGSQGAVVTMADMSTLEVEADVSESNVAKIKVEQPVEITLDAFPDTRLRGSVARIVPTVDRAKATVMTKVRFDTLDPRILPEMSAKVVFLSQPATDADQKPVIAVNPKAMAERDGKKVVFRIQGDSVEMVQVTPARMLGDALELDAPALKPGEKVVLNPAPQLAGGAKVTVAGK